VGERVGNAPLAVLGRGRPLEQHPRETLLEHFPRQSERPHIRELVLAKETTARLGLA